MPIIHRNIPNHFVFVSKNSIIQSTKNNSYANRLINLPSTKTIGYELAQNSNQNDIDNIKSLLKASNLPQTEEGKATLLTHFRNYIDITKANMWSKDGNIPITDSKKLNSVQEIQEALQISNADAAALKKYISTGDDAIDKTQKVHLNLLQLKNGKIAVYIKGLIFESEIDRAEAIDTMKGKSGEILISDEIKEIAELLGKSKTEIEYIVDISLGTHGGTYLYNKLQPSNKNIFHINTDPLLFNSQQKDILTTKTNGIILSPYLFEKPASLIRNTLSVKNLTLPNKPWLELQVYEEEKSSSGAIGAVLSVIFGKHHGRGFNMPIIPALERFISYLEKTNIDDLV